MEEARAAGNWIIEACNAVGLYDDERADHCSTGVWRTEHDEAVAHCGDRVVTADGTAVPVAVFESAHTMVGASAINPPVSDPCLAAQLNTLLQNIRRGWGWARPIDAEVYLGWVAAAFLGGFPDWRTHLHVSGGRGSGKSSLMEVTSLMLGDLAGGILNDVTEAGIRQARNNQARPLLMDEFEPEQGRSSRQGSIISFIRLMSGGGGGKIARGSSDHTSKSFRALGPVYLSAINHVEFAPQDRSRFVFLQLDALPALGGPVEGAERLQQTRKMAKRLSSALWARMLAQSVRWDRDYLAVKASLDAKGADARQAATIATIVLGRDLLLYEGSITEERLEHAEELMRAMLADASVSTGDSEAEDALGCALDCVIPLDHGVGRSVREILGSLLADIGEAVLGGEAALNRAGVFIRWPQREIAIRTGAKVKLFEDSKWAGGAHSSALSKLPGAAKSANSINLAPGNKQRAVLIPIGILGFESSSK
ncbi:hypothetical protein [Palleronia salina]|nr:hypothetical protein [Palleronia salina]